MSVADAVIQRVELASFFNALSWGDDGSLAINTAGQLTILSPKYPKNDTKINNKNIANDLFDIEKIDLETLPRNNFFLSEAPDEIGSTLFSGVDVEITKFKWSPLSRSNECYLAILTNRSSLIILKNGKFWKDLTSQVVAQSQSELDMSLVMSFDWKKNDDGELCLITGLVSGHTRIHQFQNDAVMVLDPVAVSDSSIMLIKSFQSGFVAVSSVNEIFLVEDTITQLKEVDRPKIYDVLISVREGYLYFNTVNKLTRIQLNTKESTELRTGIPSISKMLFSGPNDILIVSDLKTIKVNLETFLQVTDNLVEPVIQSKLKRWNSNFNDFNTKIYKLKTFGIDLNYNGNLIAVLYEIQNVNGLRYTISSENTFKISFIPTNNDSFENEGSSLAIFQNYKLTGFFQEPKTFKKQNPDFTLPFDEYLENVVLRDPAIKTAWIKNLIAGGQDQKIKKIFSELIIKYVESNKLALENKIDRIVYNNFLAISNEGTCSELSEEVTFKTESFDQKFDFKQASNTETLQSTDGLIWTRCSLTFLPILTPKVKADPVTDRRIIDIERDKYNQYGDFTRSILKLNSVSLYSGSNYVTMV